MSIRYKQKCSLCKKNYVTASWKERYILCYDCQKKDLDGEIKDAGMKKLFNLPEEYYRENAFLRSIKINYLRYGKLTEKQVHAFKETVRKIREEKSL